MPILSSAFFATGVEPLFGSAWLALLAVLGGVALLLFVVASVGRWLAATHPEEVAPSPRASASPAAPVAPSVDEIPSSVLAAIAAAVATTLGPAARIAAIKLPAATADTLLAQWSLEGRRQIYSSHKVR